MPGEYTLVSHKHRLYYFCDKMAVFLAYNIDKLIVFVRNIYLNSVNKIINNKWLKRQCGNTKLSLAIVTHTQLESAKIDH